MTPDHKWSSWLFFPRYTEISIGFLFLDLISFLCIQKTGLGFLGLQTVNSRIWLFPKRTKNDRVSINHKFSSWIFSQIYRYWHWVSRTTNHKFSNGFFPQNIRKFACGSKTMNPKFSSWLFCSYTCIYTNWHEVSLTMNHKFSSWRVFLANYSEIGEGFLWL